MRAKLIHRLRRSQREKLFADLDLHAGDALHVHTAQGLWSESKIVDFIWQFGGYRRFVVLKNGMHVRVGAPSATLEVDFRKAS